MDDKNIIQVIWDAVKKLALKVIEMVRLAFAQVVNWFRTVGSRIKAKDKDNIAFTLHRLLESGEHETIQGIFNKRTDEFPEDMVRDITSQELDADMAAAHANKELVIYE
ncbi:hypothetical protein AGMMS49944_10450 [Spirochaetia bacterium]|nr:hypothetical protein AGMMS49944_10450 [Spirochaetia bacterium]